MKKSQCCAADAKAVVGGEGTGYYACAKCGKEFREAKKKMTNYEKICEAWRIGWAAVIQHIEEESESETGIDKRIIVVGVNLNLDIINVIVCFGKGYAYDFSAKSMDKFDILGYKYAGELAGNEEPREGQKFINKEDYKIWRFANNKLTERIFDINYRDIDKMDYEPFFE